MDGFFKVLEFAGLVFEIKRARVAARDVARIPDPGYLRGIRQSRPIERVCQRRIDGVELHALVRTLCAVDASGPWAFS